MTYTVKVFPNGSGFSLWETTNAISVVQNHEPDCHLVTYIEAGRTNEFHCWAMPMVVTTNDIVGIDWSKAGEQYSTNAAFTRAALEAPANLKSSGYMTNNGLLLTFTNKTLMMIDTNDTSWVTFRHSPLDTFNNGLMVGIIIALQVWVILSDTSPIWRKNRKP